MTTPVFTGTATAGATVKLYDGAALVGTGLADSTGTWSVTTAALAAGTHTITAKTVDLAGNVSTPSAALSVTIMTAAPVAPSAPDLLAASDSGASNTDNVTNVTTPVFTGTATAGATVQLYDGAALVGTGLADSTGTWLVTTAALAAGTHTITAKTADLAGNVSTPSAALKVTIMTAAPVAPSAPDLLAASDSGASNTDNITNVTRPNFTGKSAANATIQLFDGTTVVGTGTADRTGAWSVTTAALAAGTHAITAEAVDLAGNVSALSAALAVTIDTAATVPSTPDLLAASDSGASNTDNITNVTRPVFTGTAEAGATVKLYDRTVLVGTGTADSTGAWSITTSKLIAGLHTLTAKAIDLAGNVSAASAALSVTIDTAAPAAPGITKVTTSAISGTAEANSIVTLFDGKTQIGSSTSIAGGWSVPIALTANTHALTAKATDLAGNVSAPSTVLTTTIGTSGDDHLSVRMEFVSSVGAGQSIINSGMLVLDQPAQFAGHVTLTDPTLTSGVAVAAPEIDLVGLANATSYTFKNDMLSVYSSNAIIDRLHLTDQTAHGFMVEKATGRLDIVAITDPSQAVPANVLALHG